MTLRIIVAAVSTVAIALIVGIPTGFIETSRSTPVTQVPWRDHLVWAATAALTGAPTSTCVKQPAAMSESTQERQDALRQSAFAVRRRVPYPP